MYCDHPSCKKEVDINSVAVSNPKRAYSMDMEGGLNPTIITSSNAQIINVCKNCGKSEHLYSTKSEVDGKRAKAKAKAIEKARLEKQGVRLVNWIILIITLLIFFAGVSSGDFISGFFGALIIGFIPWIITSRKTHL